MSLKPSEAVTLVPTDKQASTGNAAQAQYLASKRPNCHPLPPFQWSGSGTQGFDQDKSRRFVAVSRRS